MCFGCSLLWLGYGHYNDANDFEPRWDAQSDYTVGVEIEPRLSYCITVSCTHYRFGISSFEFLGHRTLVFEKHRS